MNNGDIQRLTYAVHGLPVAIDCAVPILSEPIQRALAPFAESCWPPGFTPTVGSIRLYDPTDFTRHLSPTARKVTGCRELVELYEEDGRFWMIDDRWGMTEINLLKNMWRSWVLPQPRLDPVRCVEQAVLWPMAQLLRGRGLYLVPAISAVRDGWGVMIFSSFNLEPELVALIDAGYKIIGQQWTGVREEDGRIALLHLPGSVERSAGRRLRALSGESIERADLMDEHAGAIQNHSFCDAVLVTEPSRRVRAHLREIADTGQATTLLRQAWPITELHPHRRAGQLPAKLVQHCTCAQLQLSRDPQDLPALLDSLRDHQAPMQLTSAPAYNGDFSLTPWAELDLPPIRMAG